MIYFKINSDGLKSSNQAESGMKPLTAAADWLLPPVISQLHEHFFAWQTAGKDPGPITPERVWISQQGALALAFPQGRHPEPLGHLGLAPTLATWLVCLDKWMETFVLVARARSVWTPTELAGALTFTTPTLLPPALLQFPPAANWERVARSLAAAVADGPLQGTPTNQHWKEVNG